MEQEKANMAARYEHEIPEGYEARIDGNKVIIEKKESEDERIRKELIGYLVHMADVTAFLDETKDCKRWIAHLEKQKEVDYLGTKISFPAAYSVVSDAGYVIVPKKEYEEHLDEIRQYAYNKGIVDTEEKQKEQKPTEWSEEDEAAFGDLMWCIERARKSAKDENDMGNIWFAENWVKNRLKSLRPQPKQEWSEEEERHLYNAIEAVKYVYDISEGTNGFKCVEFLKSFRPQPHWKPSEQ